MRVCFTGNLIERSSHSVCSPAKYCTSYGIPSAFSLAAFYIKKTRMVLIAMTIYLLSGSVHCQLHHFANAGRLQRPIMPRSVHGTRHNN